MAENQEILLELHCIDDSGMPREALYRLESLVADEVRATIFTAALMLSFDASEESPTHSNLVAVRSQIQAATESGAELRRSWLDRRDELQALVSQATAWRDSVSTAVLVQGHWRSVAWTGCLGDLVPAAIQAVQAVTVKPDLETARRIAGWPVPVPEKTGKTEIAPKATSEVTPTGSLELTPADLNSSIQAAKAKAAKLTSPEIAKIGKVVSLHELSKELTNEQKVQALVAGGLALPEARKLVRSGKA